MRLPVGISEPSQPQEYKKKYMRRSTLVSGFLGLLLVASWFPEIVLSQAPIVAVSISILIASTFIVLLSYSQFKIDRKYKHVTATTKDYFVSNTPLYLIALIPGLVLLGYENILPKFGVLTVAYVDGLFLCILVFLARFPLALRLGQRAVPITDPSLLSSFSVLARKMDIPRVNLYSIDWRKFKVANAFQAGPRKFSVFISNYLLDNMTQGEVSAVMAHELAHAKMKHVLKATTLLLGTSMVGADFLVLGVVFNQASLWGAIPIAAGIGMIFLGPQLLLRLQRKFEFEADEIAVRIIGDGEPMISALRKLMDLNLIPAERKSGTHPSVTKRIQKIEGIATA